MDLELDLDFGGEVDLEELLLFGCMGSTVEDLFSSIKNLLSFF